MNSRMPEFFLQPPDLVADGGLGDVQFLRGVGETEVPCGGLECAQPLSEGNLAVIGPSNA